MERIGVLINKLQELYHQKAATEQLLHVTQMLQTELFQAKQPARNTEERKKVAVIMPATLPSEAQVAEAVPSRTAIVLPEQPVHLAATPADEISTEAPPAEEETSSETYRFNVLEEVPTLAHQPAVQEKNDAVSSGELSLNEKFAERKKELGETLNSEPLKDIKKAISLNDRYIFITELFRGDEAMYERSLKTINHFSIYAEAEFWIQRELKLKLGWNEELPSVKIFDQLVQRRFR